MKWSFQIARIFGIPIRVHLAFLLLVAVLVVGKEGERIVVYPAQLIVVALLFGSVLVHELCHSLTAIRKGVRVNSITLLPIGGVAQMATMPEEPAD
ncbi:MAG: site-2 protease family protein, partial [Planctomycetes bacterium]|nr:site-2 protease family protein [Planctomycetota bacterium]